MAIPDRNIPFYNIIMRCEKLRPMDYTLPEGYSFKEYQPGFEKDWAKIEHEVGDFKNLEDGEKYFREHFMGDIEELKKRGVFIVDKDGNMVGSIMSWIDKRGKAPVNALHWLVVSPHHQGLGLGKIAFHRGLEIFNDNNEFPVYLHTQPWSWPALFIYVKEGFKFQKTRTFALYENQYDKAFETLKGLMSEEKYNFLKENSDE